ncbi:hypothetical protein NEPAR06_0577 [Nematocida parisii]|nr:hypothetical protein NEPAR08_0353 [Nematocida parisii]KAI5127149.1 hypothetical protein NEPAR03_0816 [Nematocida parisii]KAI5153583.1 hypothetical protein NEPAR06_0577 [Nematocida parisii]
MCGLISHSLDTSNRPEITISQIDILNPSNWKIDVTEARYILPEETISEKQVEYKKLFKLYVYAPPSKKIEKDYVKLKKILENTKKASINPRLDIKNNTYLKKSHDSTVKPYGYIIIGPLDLSSKNMILTELKDIENEVSHVRFPYTDSSNKRISLLRILYNESRELTFFKAQLIHALKSIDLAFCKSVEYTSYMSTLTFGFNMLNIINSIRVNRLLDVLHMQKTLRFENHAVGQIEYYKEINGIILNKDNESLWAEEMAQNEFKYILKHQGVFMPSISDVKYKKIIIHSTCLQILNLIPVCREQIKMFNIGSKKQKKMLKSFRIAYKYAIKTLKRIKSIDSYSFDPYQIAKIEDVFSLCIINYLDAEVLVSSSISSLKNKIESALYEHAPLKNNTSPSTFRLNATIPTDKKKINLLKNLVSLLDSEKELCALKKISVHKIINGIQPVKKGYLSISYSTYVDKVLKNNKAINKKLREYRLELKSL